MFKYLRDLLTAKPRQCDHVYFPVMAGDRPIGQECAICHKFNSLEEVNAAFEKASNNQSSKERN